MGSDITTKISAADGDLDHRVLAVITSELLQFIAGRTAVVMFVETRDRL